MTTRWSTNFFSTASLKERARCRKAVICSSEGWFTSGLARAVSGWAWCCFCGGVFRHVPVGQVVKHPLLGRSLPASLPHMRPKREIGMKLEAMGLERHTRVNASRARRFENSREKPCLFRFLAKSDDEQKLNHEKDPDHHPLSVSVRRAK